jgi:hypothetical protein
MELGFHSLLSTLSQPSLLWHLSHGHSPSSVASLLPARLPLHSRCCFPTLPSQWRSTAPPLPVLLPSPPFSIRRCCGGARQDGMHGGPSRQPHIVTMARDPPGSPSSPPSHSSSQPRPTPSDDSLLPSTSAPDLVQRL